MLQKPLKRLPTAVGYKNLGEIDIAIGYWGLN
jgi:hypothetical protein